MQQKFPEYAARDSKISKDQVWAVSMYQVDIPGCLKPSSCIGLHSRTTKTVQVMFLCCVVGTLVSCLIGSILRVPLGHVLWICGPLAVALSLAFMQLTGTIHPPGIAQLQMSH